MRAHLSRNFKSYLGTERSRFVKKLKDLSDCGYNVEELEWKGEIFKPHYFSQRAWNSIIDYWRTPEFKKLSDAGKKAREKMEFTSRSGAKPYELRRHVSLYLMNRLICFLSIFYGHTNSCDTVWCLFYI